MDIFLLVVALFIYQHAEDVITSHSTNASFNCSATGLPRPTIKWYKQLQNGTLQLINSAGKYSISSLASGTQNLTSQLTISGTALTDTGTYVCQAISANKNETSSAFLTVLGKLQLSNSS